MISLPRKRALNRRLRQAREEQRSRVADKLARQVEWAGRLAPTPSKVEQAAELLGDRGDLDLARAVERGQIRRGEW